MTYEQAYHLNKWFPITRNKYTYLVGNAPHPLYFHPPLSDTDWGIRLPQGLIEDYLAAQTYVNNHLLMLGWTDQSWGIDESEGSTGLAGSLAGANNDQFTKNTKILCKHEFVDVGFTHSKWVCKHCNVEQTAKL